MRPTSIVRFEWVALLGLALAAATLIMTPRETTAAFTQSGISLTLTWAIYAGVFAFFVALTLLASRRRSNIARWLIALLMVAGIVMSVQRVPDMLGNGAVGIAELVQLLLQAAAVYFLFAPDSRRWFAERPAATDAA